MERTMRGRGQVTLIDVLNDDVLLVVFDFYVADARNQGYTKRAIEAWQSLVHVCRRWRSLVFESPRRLNLQLWCTPETPAKDTLDVWPALPLLVNGSMTGSGTDNVITALRQSNRVRQVSLFRIARWQLDEVFAAMQVPFPELTELHLLSFDDPETTLLFPDSFLGGSAPRLKYYSTFGILLLGLPRLLLSATHLVQLLLSNIPYISPEAIASSLSVLPSLQTLSLGFRSSQSRPDWETQRPPPSKRSVIPALNTFLFRGITEYLGDLVTFIDAPQLHALCITFFNQVDFNCPRLTQFIDCTPTLRALDEAHVQFDDGIATVKLRYRISKSSHLLIDIICRGSDRQLSSINQVCNSSLYPLSTVEDLYIEYRLGSLVWKNDAIEDALWLEILLPFTAVKNLYLSKEFAPSVAAALQELVGTRITEVLPSLQNLFVEGLEPSGPFQENIGQFVAARQLSDHPIAISESVWDKDSNTKPI